MQDERTESTAVHVVPMRANVRITIQAGCDAIERVIGPDGDEWRSVMYPSMRSADDVLEHFASNALRNGVTDACQLDGWADLGAEQVRLDVMWVEFGG